MSTPLEEKSEKEKSAFDIMKNWFLNSPTHGIRRISRANSVIGRLFWSTTFLIFTTLMCIFIYTIVKKYSAHPTKISLSVRQYRDPKHIPAITFCNLNPLRDEKFLDEGKNGTHPSYPDDEYQHRFSEYMYGILAGSINKSQQPSTKYGYKLEDLLITCTFNGRDCHKNFTLFFHPSYGNCYTFNYSDSVEIEENLNSHFWSGDDESDADGYKLFLELYLYQNEYIAPLNDRAAFRIFIHRKNEIPILSENNLFLSPSTYTKLIFSQRIITFSQQCRKDLSDEMKQIFSPDSIRYSQELCFKVCEFRYIEKVCQCTDQSFMVFLPFISQNQINQINTNKSCLNQNNCPNNHGHFNARQFCPQCLPECELIQYTVQSSYADYPNPRSSDKILKRIEKHFKEISYVSVQGNTATCINNRKGNLLDDIVAVEISASPYATEILAESPMYTWVDLISSIGGQAGLWIGVSLISFVEMAELLFLLLCHFIKKICNDILNRWKNFNQNVLVRKRLTKL